MPAPADAGALVEDDHCFALVGDAHAEQIQVRVPVDQPVSNRKCVGPDLVGVVLDPAGAGIELAVDLIRSVDLPGALIEQNGLRGGSALVDGEDGSHRSGRRLPLRSSSSAVRARPSMVMP